MGRAAPVALNRTLVPTFVIMQRSETESRTAIVFDIGTQTSQRCASTHIVCTRITCARILSSPIPSTCLVGLSLCASHPKNVGYVEIQVQRASDYASRQSIAIAYYPDLVFRFLQLFNGDWAPLLRDMAFTIPASR